MLGVSGWGCELLLLLTVCRGRPRIRGVEIVDFFTYKTLEGIGDVDMHVFVHILSFCIVITSYYYSDI